MKSTQYSVSHYHKVVDCQYACSAAYIHIGIKFLANVAFEHVEAIGKRVIILGGGNTAMNCCRTARRICDRGWQIDCHAL